MLVINDYDGCGKLFGFALLCLQLAVQGGSRIKQYWEFDIQMKSSVLIYNQITSFHLAIILLQLGRSEWFFFVLDGDDH